MNWKVVAGFAVVGALISLIAGVAGGNPFGIILLRLVLSALVFAGLGAAVELVLRRFMPELLSRAGAPAEPRVGPAEPGVDIVIDEDIPLEDESLLEDRPPTRRTESGLSGAGESPGADAGGLVADGELSEALEAGEDMADLEGFSAAEMAEGLSPALEAGGPREASPAGAEAPAASWEPLGEEIGSLDALPELEQPSSGDDTRPAQRSPREAARAQVDRAVAGQDPADLAKAVRTFLRKDQEG